MDSGVRAAGPEFVVPVTIQDNRPIVKITFGSGKATEALIDSGSSVSLLPKALYTAWKHLLPKLMHAKFTATTVNGTRVLVEGLILRTNFTLRRKNFSSPLLVAEEVKQVILGSDFLVDNAARLSYAEKEIQFFKKAKPSFGVTKQQISLKPMESKVIVAEIDKHNRRRGPLMTEAWQQAPLDLMIYHGIVKTRKSKIRLEVRNETVNSITIPRGWTICSLSPVDIIKEPPKSEEDYKLPEIPTDLPPEAKEKLRQTLEEFKDIFSQSPTDLGCTNTISHHINTGTAPPVRQPARYKPPKAREIENQHLAEMGSADIIEPSNSPYGAPVVLVKKKDGTTRFCIDYRRLNDITVKDAIPIPRIDMALDNLHGAKYFTTLDLAAGYFQVPLDEESKPKTAFRTTNGLWQFKRMPFGLCNAPATFVRLMEKVLEGLLYDQVLVYLDDVIIFSKTIEEHIERMRTVFQRIRIHNLKLKPTKCDLAEKEVKFLGHMVNEDGVQPDPENVRAIKDIPTPFNSASDIRRFIGMAAYYRRFIKDFTQLTHPLRQLITKHAPKKITWTEELEKATQEIKNKLIGADIMAYPDPSKPYILHTDGSSHGLGAILSQTQNGRTRVIQYASRALHGAECRYHATQLEALALGWALKKMHPYIFGQHVDIYTDHAALRWLREQSQINSSYARWFNTLESYSYSIHHRKGNRMQHVDCLSRLPVQPLPQEVGPVDDTELFIGSVDCEEEQEEINRIIHFLKGPNIPCPDRAVFRSLKMEELFTENGILYLQPNKQVLTSNQAKEEMKNLHQGPEVSHFGYKRTYAAFRDVYYHPRAAYLAREVVKTCHLCQITKVRTHPPRAPLKKIHADRPNQLLGVDFVGPIYSLRDCTYLLTIIDHFTKFLTVIPCKLQTTEAVVSAIQQHGRAYGRPELILSDQGTQFTSPVFKQHLEDLGIGHITTPAYHPQANGTVERSHRTINEILRRISTETTSPLLALQTAVDSYNNLPHSVTKVPPAHLQLGRPIRTNDMPLNIGVFSTAEEYQLVQQDLIKGVTEVAKEQLNRAVEHMNDYQRIHFTEGQFPPGTWVLVEQRPRAVGTIRHGPLRSGPFKVLSEISTILRLVDLPRGPEKIHVNRLTKYQEETAGNLPQAEEEEGLDPTAENSEENEEPDVLISEGENNGPPIPRPRSKRSIKPPTRLLENCAVDFNQRQTSSV